ncbi:hypothetical protein PtB15_17B397 [Puccinia triticina]|nr:hypothetical protein PtB15_17B397 [Puccinia triticina]
MAVAPNCQSSGSGPPNKNLDPATTPLTTPAMTDNPEATTSHTMTNDESMDEDPAPTGCALPAVAFPSFVWTGLM